MKDNRQLAQKTEITKVKKEARLIKNRLGHNIKTLRRSAKISQTELAKILALHQTALCRVEQGVQNLTPEDLFIVSRYFNVNIDVLISSDIAASNKR